MARALVMGVVIAALAVGAGGVALWRLSQAGPPGGGLAVGGPATGGVSASDGAARAGRAGRARAGVEAIQPRVQAGLDELARGGVMTLPQAQELGERVREQVGFTLDPSFEVWHARARGLGVEVAGKSWEADAPFSQAEFERGAAMLADAEYAWGEARVRVLYERGVRREAEMEGAGARAPAVMRPKVPKPTDPEAERATIVQVLVPARVRMMEDPRREARVGFGFWWQEGGGEGGGGRWLPWDVTVYFGPGKVELLPHPM